MAHTARAYHGLSSMKRPEVFQGILDKYLVKGLAQKHNTIRETNALTIRVPGLPGGGEVLSEQLVGGCDLLSKHLTLLMTNICDFPCHIYDLN